MGVSSLDGDAGRPLLCAPVGLFVVYLRGIAAIQQVPAGLVRLIVLIRLFREARI
jgi:hypothetical protein